MVTLAPSLLAGAAMFAFVGLKAFQQRSVAFDAPWIAIIPTSLAMAFTEVYVISVVVRVGYHVPTVLCIGLGAGLGSLAAMALHRRVFGDQGRGTKGDRT